MPARAESGQPGQGSSAGDQLLIDRVVAVVNGQLITLSDLQFEARVALVQKGGVAAVDAPLDIHVLRATLELSIAQRLQNDEADRLQAFPLDEAAVLARYKTFEAQVGGPLALKHFLDRSEADSSQLLEVLGRAVRAERILDSKVHLRAQVSDLEVRREFEAHPGRYGGSYEAAHGLIRDALTRDRYTSLAKEELQKVRAAGTVRIVAPFARQGGPGAEP